VRRLTTYLARLFATDALLLFGIVCFLVWLTNMLRGFDVVSSKGQGIGTLIVQGLLTMPPLAISFFYVCIGIGMARALQQLAANRELHIIHSSHGLSALWRATGVVALGGVLCVLLLSNFLEPYANRRLNVLTASIAADLVSSTLKPKQFTQVSPGVVLLIGGRSGNGQIDEFFADDRRDPDTRRTYIARTARVFSDGENYLIELRDGSLQYVEADGRFSEVSFERYNLNVERLSQPVGSDNPIREQDSYTLVTTQLAAGIWSPDVVKLLGERFNEALRVVGICILVLAISGFPSGRRSRLRLPMEAGVLLITFGERGLSAYSPLGTATGAMVMIAVGLVLLAVRSWPRRVAAAVPS
jgi:lipopolysaccharide export system permease protein